MYTFSRPHLSLVADGPALAYDEADFGYDAEDVYDDYEVAADAPAEQSPLSFWADTTEGGSAAWRLDALCAETDPEAFFPEKGGSTREAKRVCTGCTVRAECLEFALANDERFGIWGGLSERERRRVRLERRERLSA
ncbi:WhiB family transcriptional regulator [Geodermatophilus nigrescens]|uniref:Transcriptional regulator WhiB n=1 Tax=Geodermatophilus nigrescens TaxID=1070870 RepID=A0A1M5IB08_9ACTN|nr:WhiB family transcriptional regulator, redox-sensing transcriptional regulator [Geodermatophilus nigrescens]